MMSKQTKRKITVDLAKAKELLNRPSVFQRLGTKKNSAAKKSTECCRQWALNGTCAYGKGCKYAATHTLISPSKQRAANKEGSVKDDVKSRLHSTVVVRSGRSPGGEMDNWDQSDLEYADTDVLEKRRQQLQRELELQLRMDVKDKKKVPSTGSSSSSRSSSSSSVTSSSSATSTSDSNDRDNRKKIKRTKHKRSSTSSSERNNSKKKASKLDTIKRKKIISGKKGLLNKEDRMLKKQDHSLKKKVPTKPRKKSLSPGKKSGGTPPIGKIAPKGYTLKHSKSPIRRDKNRTASPPTSKDRDKDRERLKDRDKERTRARSRSPKLIRRSRSPLRRHGSHPKDPRRKESSERSRPLSPKKSRRDTSTEKLKKLTALARDDRRTHKDRSLEQQRKDKHEERERTERERKEREKLEALNRQRERERLKDQGKRDADSKRSRARERDRGLNKGKGLEKPSKPMERLLPRPEERMAAIAAITNRPIETEKSLQASKDIDRNVRKDRLDRERTNRTMRGSDRMDSLEKEHGEYDRSLDMPYEHLHSTERPYDRVNDRYEEARDLESGSPGSYAPRERVYGPAYDLPGHPRNYTEGDERIYGEHIAGDIGFDDRRARRDHSWDGRDVSLERERPYRGHPGHPPHKEWESEEFHADWGRERHWPPPHCSDPQVQEWGDKEPELEGPWMHRTQPPPGGPRGRVHDPGYGRNIHMDPSLPVHAMPANMKRRAPMRPDDAPGKKMCATPMPTVRTVPNLGLPPHGPSTHGPPAHSLPVHKPPPHGVPAHGPPAHGPLALGPPVHGPSSHGTPAHGPPKHALPQHVPTTHTAITHDSSAEDNAIPDDLSEISDDADDILNMDDKELGPKIITEEVKVESQEQNEVDDAIDNLDFEEISDGELEEDQRVKGLGDALGVDWASLVAEVRKSKETSADESTSGARERWRPARVLARVGLSLEMAGSELLQEVLATATLGNKEEETHKPVHPVASIQVSMVERVRQRSVLLGASGLTRALSARRDLALRRRLCALPALERAPPAAGAPHPAIFAAARALLLQPG